MKVAVIGGGVVGLSATARLLADGADVVCYERSSAAMNERSAGSSRIFRLAHPSADLVRLAASALTGFRRWERVTGTSLITTSGCVISGSDVVDWAAAMREAGAGCEIVEAGPGELRLPVRRPPRTALIDPAGGVIDVDSVRAHLVALTRNAIVREAVYALEGHPTGATVCSPTAKARYHAVVLAGGAGTSPLAAQAGIYTPSGLAHHFRFTFPIDTGPPWRCWIDRPAIGLGTYQHQSGAGSWSVGGHLDPALTAWEVGRDAAQDASREAVLRYVHERLTVRPRIIDSLYCAETPGLGDGFEIRRNGSIVAIYGENLFKLAPLLGDVLAAAVSDGSTPSVAQLASG